MSTTDVAVRERQLTVLTNDQLQYIANTEFVPPGLRGNLPAILACVATGRAIGIADMTSLRSIHIIDGQATFSAELMVLLVRRAGHSISGDVSADKAVVTGKRADTDDEMTVTWTLEMADRAGLQGKSNWKKYPEAMLWARAVSQLCRMLFADCFAGTTYTAEELEEGALEGASVTESTGAPSNASTMEPAAKPTDESASAPGSASALSQFNQLAATAGISTKQIRAKADELFGDRPAADLSEQELKELWESLAGAGVSE